MSCSFSYAANTLCLSELTSNTAIWITGSEDLGLHIEYMSHHHASHEVDYTEDKLPRLKEWRGGELHDV